MIFKGNIPNDESQLTSTGLTCDTKSFVTIHQSSTSQRQRGVPQPAGMFFFHSSYSLWLFHKVYSSLQLDSSSFKWPPLTIHHRPSFSTIIGRFLESQGQFLSENLIILTQTHLPLVSLVLMLKSTSSHMATKCQPYGVSFMLLGKAIRLKILLTIFALEECLCWRPNIFLSWFQDVTSIFVIVSSSR